MQQPELQTKLIELLLAYQKFEFAEQKEQLPYCYKLLRQLKKN
jgi:hypothetical protein